MQTEGAHGAFGSASFVVLISLYCLFIQSAPGRFKLLNYQIDQSSRFLSFDLDKNGKITRFPTNAARSWSSTASIEKVALELYTEMQLL